MMAIIEITESTPKNRNHPKPIDHAPASGHRSVPAEIIPHIIGITHDINKRITVHETTIAYAVDPATVITDDPHTNKNAKIAAVQMAYAGVLNRGDTLASRAEHGKPSSRAKA